MERRLTWCVNDPAHQTQYLNPIGHLNAKGRALGLFFLNAELGYYNVHPEIFTKEQNIQKSFL